MKRAGAEQPEGGYQSLDGSAADTFRDVGAPTPVDDRVEHEHESARPVAEPGALADLPVGLFEPYSDTIDEKVAIHAATPPVAREQYRRLAATLHHVQAERGIKTILVASAMASEGKTLSAVNTALTLSESYRRRVLLIDADLRRPSVHEVLGFDNVVGLTDALASRDERRLPIIAVSPRLSVLPAGRPNADPMEALTSSRMLKILDEASAVFDWVVIDTPPVGLLPDANLLAAMVDGAIFVVAANRTPFAAVSKAVEALGRDRILGVVLNRVEARDSTPHDYYYKYYSQATPKRSAFGFAPPSP